MQTCDVCGSDTRDGTRVCTSCRDATATPDNRRDRMVSTPPTSTDAAPGDADTAGGSGAGVAGPTGAPEVAAGAGPAHATRGRGDQIVLRKVDPTDDPTGSQARRQASTVTTSLLAAFAARTDAGARPAAAGTGTATDVRGGGPDTARAGTERAPGRFANVPTVPLDPPDTKVTAGSRAPDPTSTDHTSATPPPSKDASSDDTDDDAPAAPAPAPDPWTTVAQVTLLSIGVLAVIQLVVLLIVNHFLASTASGAARDTVGVLAAHGKVTTVMLPALVGGAVAAVALAVWRTRSATPPDAAGVPRPGRHLLGVPATLWLAGAATVTLLGVVLAGSSASVAAARQTTIGAIATCAGLAAAFLVAPRSLAASPARDDAPDDDAPTDASGSPGPLVGVG